MERAALAELEQDFERENPAQKTIKCDKCSTRVVITTYCPRVSKFINRVKNLRLQRYQPLPRLLEEEGEVEEQLRLEQREEGAGVEGEEAEGAVGGE